MAQDPTRVIPGDYSATAYDVLSKYDPAFPENVSVEDFFENLQSPEYAAKAYSLLADSDPELVENLSLDEFIDNVKKKTSPSLRNLFRTLVHRSNDLRVGTSRPSACRRLEQQVVDV